MILLKQTGITRRVDELGRIVIPKEIRKNLKIRDNDELLINVNDDNIVLCKHERFTEDEILKLLVKSFSKELKKNIVITSKDKVIVSSSDKYNDIELSNSIINGIVKRDCISSLNPSKVSLFNEVIEVSYIINPFCVSSDVVGSIIVFSDDNLDDNVSFCVNIIKRFLENYLEE